MIYLFIFFIFVRDVFGHSVELTVNKSNAVSIKIYYSNGEPFSYEKYEIFSPEDEVIPFQTGFTNRYGVITFIPDLEGEWKVKVFSEDGHGVVETIRINNIQDFISVRDDRSKLVNFTAGLSTLLLIFSVLYIIRLKKGKK
ncbi:hypothetical protein [Persephonella sp.]